MTPCSFNRHVIISAFPKCCHTLPARARLKYIRVLESQFSQMELLRPSKSSINTNEWEWFSRSVGRLVDSAVCPPARARSSDLYESVSARQTDKTDRQKDIQSLLFGIGLLSPYLSSLTACAWLDSRGRLSVVQNACRDGLIIFFLAAPPNVLLFHSLSLSLQSSVFTLPCATHNVSATLSN